MHIVCFEQNPSLKVVKEGLTEITGLDIAFREISNESLLAMHETNPKSFVELDWINKLDRNCIRIESDSPKCSYLEASSIFTLLNMGGRLEEHYLLPAWAGKKWNDIRSDSAFSRFLFWYKYRF